MSFRHLSSGFDGLLAELVERLEKIQKKVSHGWLNIEEGRSSYTSL
jgi:hypothetical protein